VIAPGVDPAVTVVCAWPCAFVAALAGLKVTPLLVDVNVTLALATGAVPFSTSATSGAPKAVLTTADCPPPDTAFMAVALMTTVSVNVATMAPADTLIFTLPAVFPKVTVAKAWPLEFVLELLLLSVADPDTTDHATGVAVNGFPPTSVTWASKLIGSTMPGPPLWLLPARILTTAGAPIFTVTFTVRIVSKYPTEGVTTLAPTEGPSTTSQVMSPFLSDTGGVGEFLQLANGDNGPAAPDSK
jgi:hypothetical protein